MGPNFFLSGVCQDSGGVARTFALAHTHSLSLPFFHLLLLIELTQNSINCYFFVVWFQHQQERETERKSIFIRFGNSMIAADAQVLCR